MKSFLKAITFTLLTCALMFSCNPIVAIPSVSPLPSVTTDISDTHSPPIQETPTFLPTETLVPALTADEAERKLIELLDNNGGCLLPCIWGYTPGQDNAHAVMSSLHSLGKIAPNDFLVGELGGGTGLIIERDGLIIETHLTIVGEEGPQSDTLRRIEMSMAIYRKVVIEGGYRLDGVYDSPYFSQLFQYYTLPYLLTNYGPPDNVYVTLYYAQEIGDSDDMYIIALDYKQTGWLAHFHMPAIQQGEYWAGCLSQAFTYLTTWAPGDSKTANEKGFHYAGESTIYFPVEEATSLTLDEFYQQFKDPENTQCLESPMELWMP